MWSSGNRCRKLVVIVDILQVLIGRRVRLFCDGDCIGIPLNFHKEPFPVVLLMSPMPSNEL